MTPETRRAIAIAREDGDDADILMFRSGLLVVASLGIVLLWLSITWLRPYWSSEAARVEVAAGLITGVVIGAVLTIAQWSRERASERQTRRREEAREQARHEQQAQSELAALRLQLAAITDLRGVDLRRKDLVGFYFLGKDLRGARFDGSDLTGANLSGAKIAGTSFRDAILTDASFHKADGGPGSPGEMGPDAPPSFDGATLDRTLFLQAVLPSATWIGARLRGADFEEASVAWSDFSSADLRGTNWSGTDASHAVFSRADFRGLSKDDPTRFFHVRAEGATFDRADFRGTSFGELRCDRASFRNTDFRGAFFFRITFYRSDVAGADFRESDLSVKPSSEAGVIRFVECENVTAATWPTGFNPKMNILRVFLYGTQAWPYPPIGGYPEGEPFVGDKSSIVS